MKKEESTNFRPVFFRGGPLHLKTLQNMHTNNEELVELLYPMLPCLIRAKYLIGKAYDDSWIGLYLGPDEVCLKYYGGKIIDEPCGKWEHVEFDGGKIKKDLVEISHSFKGYNRLKIFQYYEIDKKGGGNV